MLQRKPPTWIPGLAKRRAGARPRVPWPDPRVDALFDTYLEWRDESKAVERAYERWTESEGGERHLAYAVYRAALEREEKAADVYEVAAMELVGAVREPHERRTGDDRCH